jgi:hypothetical protein
VEALELAVALFTATSEDEAVEEGKTNIVVEELADPPIFFGWITWVPAPKMTIYAITPRTRAMHAKVPRRILRLIFPFME